MVSACGLLSLAIIFMTVSLNQAKYAMEFSNMPSPVELAAAQLRAAEAEAIKSNDEDELGPEPLTPAP